MMTGWKTWAAAGLAAAYGVGGYFLGLHGPDAMVGFVTTGLGMVGIGHKIEKSAETSSGATSAIVSDVAALVQQATRRLNADADGAASEAK